jgi:hypothetical protein
VGDSFGRRGGCWRRGSALRAAAEDTTSNEPNQQQEAEKRCRRCHPALTREAGEFAG